MERKKIEEAIKAETTLKDGKQFINCTTALAIAEKLNVKPIEVGKICNELNIKIQNCQLGCF